MHILAATDFSSRAQRGLRRAGLLARESGAELTVLHVVDDDRPADLVAIMRREAERILREQIDQIAELQGLSAHALVVEGAPFDGILRAAASAKADLIVAGVHRKELLREMLFGTTIERVIRTGPFPVLMVNKEGVQPYRTTLAALDMSDPSLNAIRTGMKVGLPEGDQLTFVHAFHPHGRGKMVHAGLSHHTIDQYVAEERDRVAQELSAFLQANGLGADNRSLRVEDGPAFEVISRAVEQLKPDVLVVGTHGRSGIAKMLLGSVAEQVLRTLEVDILAVPPRP